MVGAFEQRRRRQDVGARGGTASAEPDRDWGTLGRIVAHNEKVSLALLQRGTYALQALFRAVGQHGQELVAAPAPHRVRLAQCAEQEFSGMAQRRVADSVSVGVVDAFEFVDVEYGKIRAHH